jgi:hypothetical protein
MTLILAGLAAIGVAAALRPNSHLTLFVSPLNILLGSVVAALAAANVAVAGTRRGKRSAVGPHLAVPPARFRHWVSDSPAAHRLCC